MNKDTTLIIRINKELKDDVADIAKDNGVNLSSLINALFTDISNKGRIPINILSKCNRYTKRIKQGIDIATIKKCINEIVEQYGEDKLSKVYLFGSYARGEETSKSDIDLRIESRTALSLFEIGNIRYELKEKLGVDIDIVNKPVNQLNPEFYTSIKKDEICIHEC